MVLLVTNALEITKTSELVQDSHKLSMARMELLLLELLSLEPVTTEEAIDLELGTRILEMLLDTFKGLDGLRTAKALDLEALTLIFDVLLKILKVHALLDLVVIASVQNFDLTQHLVEKFVLNFLEDWSIDKLSRSFLVVLLVYPVVFSALDEVNIFHLEDFAAGALFLGYSLSILVGNLKLA